MKKIEPLFIIGVGRSGTSLLQSMLNAHSEITFPPETHFIRFYLSGKQDYKNTKSKIIKDQNLLKLGVPLTKVLENSNDLEHFYINLLDHYRLVKKKKYIGDKDPKNVEYLKTIKRLFPDSIIIHIYRDPRSVIASRIKADWSKDKPFWQQLLAYKAHLSYARKIGTRYFKRYVEIKYENLVLNPRIELTKVTNELGLNYETGMLQYYNSSKEIVRENEIGWKENLFNPIMQENINKWENELTKNQIRIIENVCTNEMRELGYNKSMKQSFFYGIKYFPIRLLIQILNSFYKSRLH